MLELVTAIDGWMAAFPPLLRIFVWATFTAVFSMFLYRAISPQANLTDLKKRQQLVRRSLLDYEGEFSGMMELIAQDLGLSCRQIGVIFGPVILSVVPVLAIMFCLFTLYGYRLPEPGSSVLVRIDPDSAAVHWEGKGSYTQTADGWHIGWPLDLTPLTLKDSEGTVVVTLPIKTAIPEISKASWLTMLFPNPAGEITEKSKVDAVYLDIPDRQYTDFGPDWTRGFAFWYFAVLLVVSLFIKVRFRII